MKCLRFSLLLVALLMLAGCGDDSSSDIPLDAGFDGLDECINSSDLALLTADASLPDPRIHGGVCATGVCLEDLLNGAAEDGIGCLRDCYAGSPLGTLSAECRDCFVEATVCAGLNCAVECYNNGPECVSCLASECEPRTIECTGDL